MSKGITKSGKEYIVTHLFSNGAERDDCAGILAQVNEYTEIGYRMMLDFRMRELKNETNVKVIKELPPDFKLM